MSRLAMRVKTYSSALTEGLPTKMLLRSRAAVSATLRREHLACSTITSCDSTICASKCRRQLGKRRHTSCGAAVAVEKGEEGIISNIVDVDLGERSYPIYIGQGLIDRTTLFDKHIKVPTFGMTEEI